MLSSLSAWSLFLPRAPRDHFINQINQSIDVSALAKEKIEVKRRLDHLLWGQSLFRVEPSWSPGFLGPRLSSGQCPQLAAHGEENPAGEGNWEVEACVAGGHRHPPAREGHLSSPPLENSRSPPLTCLTPSSVPCLPFLENTSQCLGNPVPLDQVLSLKHLIFDILFRRPYVSGQCLPGDTGHLFPSSWPWEVSAGLHWGAILTQVILLLTAQTPERDSEAENPCPAPPSRWFQWENEITAGKALCNWPGRSRHT